MKSLLMILSLMTLSLIAAGQGPDSLNYQAVVHDPSGKIVASGKVTFRFSILYKAPDGRDSVTYTEIQPAMTDSSGNAFCTIGNGNSSAGTFSDIDWNGAKYFLRVEIDTRGDNNFTDLGSTQILIMNGIPGSAGKNNKRVSEDKLFISRKYVGKFLDFRQTGPKTENGPNIIWIKTSMERTFGKISAYGKKCAFSIGDKLYIKRAYYNPGGVSGHWVYQIENDSNIYYKLSEFQYDRKVDVEVFFR